MLVEKKVLNLKTSIGTLNALSKSFGKELSSSRNAEIFIEVIADISGHHLTQIQEIRYDLEKLKGPHGR